MTFPDRRRLSVQLGIGPKKETMDRLEPSLENTLYIQNVRQMFGGLARRFGVLLRVKFAAIGAFLLGEEIVRYQVSSIAAHYSAVRL